MTVINGIHRIMLGFFRKPLLLKEGLGWLIGCCGVLFYAASSCNAQIDNAGFSVECGVGFSSVHSHDDKTQSLLSSPDTGCANFRSKVYNYGKYNDYQQEYDSAKKFVESCYYTNFASDGFGFADAGIQNLTDTARYRKYRYWLISVLFLNKTDPYYFCQCIFSIAQTYQYTEHIRFPNAFSSIARYMYQHKLCTMDNWKDWDSEAFVSNHIEWVGSGDSAKGIPFDTTINTMHELGLDFLDSLNLGVGPVKTLSPFYLSSFTVAPNPSQGLVTANYTLARQGFVQFTVYDALGRVIWSRAGESETEGLHQLPIDLSSSPSGTYYVRIEAGFTEVQTVKIVKEK
jgi:hypothetical protein